jgi:hypothetical protein
MLAVAALGADNPLVGVWKLNPKTSHFSPGHDLPVSLVITIEADGADGISYSSKNQLTDGSKGGASYKAKFDGKDYPMTGSPSYNQVSIRRVNPHTYHVVSKKDGAVVVDAVYTVTSDGKALKRKGTAYKGTDKENNFDETLDRQ